MVNHKTTLLLPEHVDFSSEEQEVTYEDKNIFFSSALTYDLRRLSLTNQYQNKTREVAAIDTTEHLALIEKIKNTLSYSSSITSVELDPGINEVKQLMQTLNNRLIQGE
jgi:diphthamide synthase subunit DPH2